MVLVDLTQKATTFGACGGEVVNGGGECLGDSSVGKTQV